MRNIAIMGSSGGTGKDTVADYIRTLARRDKKIEYKKIALGDPIHEFSEEILGRKPERHYLQDYGEAVRKIFGEDSWIRFLDRKIEEIDSPVIVPDIRKLIEYSHFVVEKNFLPIYVYNSPEVARKRLADRDGGYNENDLQQNIEKQLSFVETLPTKIGMNGARLVKDTGIFNDIYIVDNSRDLNSMHKQVESWWKNIGSK